MKTKTDLLLELWEESRTRFTNLLEIISESDLQKKLGGSPNSVGFLTRHIGDVELLFAKNVFGASDVKVSAKTVIEKHDTGQWTNLQDLQDYVTNSFQTLKDIVEIQTDADWDTQISTKNLAQKPKQKPLAE
jgi:uncharacterized damage-inducible protein DinB